MQLAPGASNMTVSSLTPPLGHLPPAMSLIPRHCELDAHSRWEHNSYRFSANEHYGCTLCGVRETGVPSHPTSSPYCHFWIMPLRLFFTLLALPPSISPDPSAFHCPHLLPSVSLPHFFSFDCSAVYRFLPHFRLIVKQ
jgi:hypothetical protein